MKRIYYDYTVGILIAILFYVLVALIIAPGCVPKSRPRPCPSPCPRPCPKEFQPVVDLSDMPPPPFMSDVPSIIQMAPGAPVPGPILESSFIKFPVETDSTLCD